VISIKGKERAVNIAGLLITAIFVTLTLTLRDETKGKIIYGGFGIFENVESDHEAMSELKKFDSIEFSLKPGERKKISSGYTQEKGLAISVKETGDLPLKFDLLLIDQHEQEEERSLELYKSQCEGLFLKKSVLFSLYCSVAESGSSEKVSSKIDLYFKLK
jgi:hypothetical protein